MDRILYLLVIAKDKVKLSNSLNLTDINIHAESFYKDLLNMAFGYNLKNLNNEIKNSASIDLSDKEAGVAIQITSTGGLVKTRGTIDSFVEHELNKIYDRLIIFNIVDKVSHRDVEIKSGEYTLDTKKDIWDYKDLVSQIHSLSTEKIRDIKDFLERELIRSDALDSAKTTIEYSKYQPQARKREPKSLVELLRSDIRATQLLGRDFELAKLLDWLKGKQKVAAKCIVGTPGVGKTRLGIELCEIAHEEGWLALFVNGNEVKDLRVLLDVADKGSSKNALIVVDSAATALAELKGWLSELARRVEQEAPIVRVLLLERSASEGSGWWSELLRVESNDGPSASAILENQPYTLQGLDAVEDRRSLLAEAMQKAAPLFDPPRPSIVPPFAGDDPWFDKQLSESRLDNDPLYLIMMAIRAVEVGLPAALSINKIDLVKYIADIEDQRLVKFAISRGYSDKGKLFKHIAACVTLQRGCNHFDLLDLIQEECDALKWSGYDYEEVAKDLCDFLRSPSDVEGIQPDLIGESFLIKTINGEFRKLEVAEAIVRRCAGRDLPNTVVTIILAALDLAQFRSDHESVRYLRSVIADTLEIEDLIGIAKIIPAKTLALREVRVELLERIIRIVRPLREAAPEIRNREFATFLSDYAVSLSEVGQVTEAIEFAKEAIVIRAQLAEANPQAFNPDLALSYNNLTHHYKEIGKPDEALTASQEGVRIARIVTKNRPSFAQRLAMVLRSDADALAALGKKDAALASSLEARDICKGLADKDWDRYSSDYADALDNLSNRYSALGKRPEALQASKNAVEIYRKLVIEQADAFLPNFAIALVNFANRQASLNDFSEALRADREALDIYNELDEQRPGLFKYEIAGSLNNIASHLWQDNQRQAAVSTIQQCLNCYQNLVRKHPKSLCDEYARSLENYAQFLEDDHPRRALRPIKKAVWLRRRLAAQRPVFMPKLSASLIVYSRCFADIGEEVKSLDLAREAANILGSDTTEKPDIYNAQVALAQSNLGVLCANSGMRGEAMVAARSALKVFENLAARYPERLNKHLSNACQNLGVAMRNKNWLREASEIFQRYADATRQLADDGHSEFTNTSADFLSDLSVLYSKLGNPYKGLEAAQESVRRFKMLPSIYSDLPRRLGTALSILADRLEDLEQYQRAIVYDREAVETVYAAPHRDPLWKRTLEELTRDYMRRADKRGLVTDSVLVEKALKCLRQT